MSPSLFVEHHANGCAFYINGALQFDTADEAIYHEHLVLPAIALAIQRLPQQQLRVLICGGGDGLAAREALRFAQVAEVILVDYDPNVLALGRTTFKPYNQGSLEDCDSCDRDDCDRDTTLGKGRVAVHTQDAVEFVSALPDTCFHVVVCDFVCPTSTEDTRVHSLEWFAQLQRIVVNNGIIAANAVSPDHTPAAYWCIYQTLFAAGLQPKPLQLTIPSFQQHGYGNWGFFLASPQSIQAVELQSLHFPDDLRALEPPTWLQSFVFPISTAQVRHQVYLHTLQQPQLLYYLLNPHLAGLSINSSEQHQEDTITGDTITGETISGETIDFLTVQETGTAQTSSENLLQPVSLAKLWLRQSQADAELPVSIEQLLPVQHHYHQPRMVQEWSGYVQQLLTEIDSQRLISHLLNRSKELPPKVARELQQIAEKSSKKQPLTYVSEHVNELITILAVTLLIANLATPDPVFAKGYYSGSRSGSSGSSYGGGFRFGWLGFWMMIMGGVWLWGLNRNQDD